MADNLTRTQRSWTMSRIRSRDTQPELTIRRLLHARGLRFRLHASALPGRPDVVFPAEMVAVFVDGDFWHGWRLASWRSKLAPYWVGKIEGNRSRDRRNLRRLRRLGWVVVRIWEHQVRRSADACVAKVALAVEARRCRRATAVRRAR